MASQMALLAKQFASSELDEESIKRINELNYRRVWLPKSCNSGQRIYAHDAGNATKVFIFHWYPVVSLSTPRPCQGTWPLSWRIQELRQGGNKWFVLGPNDLMLMDYNKVVVSNTLLGTNISPEKSILSRWFSFSPRGIC